MNGPKERFASALALWPEVLRLLAGMAFGTFGGWLAHLAGLPLAWLLGALVAAALLSSFGVVYKLSQIRSYALVILGLGLGQSFTAPILATLFGVLPVIVICAVLTIASGALGAWIYRLRSDIDPKTAFFCAVPGGVVLMAIHAERAGLPERDVTLAQSVRLIMVVLIYPPLISVIMPHDTAPLLDLSTSSQSVWSLGVIPWIALGLCVAIFGKRLGIPNPWMLAPTILAIGFSVADALPALIPTELVVAAQIVLGMALGTQINPSFLRSAGNLFMASVLSSILISFVLIVLGFFLSTLIDLPTAAILLGMAPGGMPEMAVTAHALGVSVPLVMGFHLVRVLIANVLIEPIWRLLCAIRVN